MGDRNRLVLHIGCLKTGSTSIQFFLDENRQALRKEGVRVIRSAGHPNSIQLIAYAQEGKLDKRTGKLASSFHRQYGLSSAKDLEDFRDTLEADLQSEVSRSRRACSAFVASNENLIGAQDDDVARLGALLKTVFDEVTIIAYLRRQDEFSVSKYSSELKSGSSKTMLETMEKHKNVHYLKYDTVLDRWASVFGKENVVPRIFAKDRLQNGDVVFDFCAAAKIPLGKDMSLPERRNVSLSSRAQRFFRQYNEKHPVSLSRMNKVTRGKLYSVLSENYPGPSEQPDRQQVESYLSYFAESNSSLSEKWFGGQGGGFSNDLSKYERPTSNEMDSVDDEVHGIDLAYWLLREWQTSLDEQSARLKAKTANLKGDGRKNRRIIWQEVEVKIAEEE